MTIRNISVTIIVGGLLAFLLYNFGFQTSNTSPFEHIQLDISKVASHAKSLAENPLQYGTAAEALLELYNSELSVFSKDPFPADKVPFAPFHHVESLEYAKKHIRIGNKTLIHDGFSTGGPASLGVSTVLLGQTNVDYLKAALQQVEFLLKEAPLLENGAISYRNSATKDFIKGAWAEFVFMVPPFLAYYSVVSNDLSYIEEARNQITLYNKLLAAGTPGRRLWRHTSSTDPGFWSTGNGWAAAGLARVLATSKKWTPTAPDIEFQSQLTKMIEEITNGVMAADDDTKSGLLRNYLKDGDSWFGDVSGTALLAATVYRMAVLEPKVFAKKFIDWADRKSKAVVKHVDKVSGIASPVVKPSRFLERTPWTTGSSEGQSFVVMLYAAQRDYLAWKKSGSDA